VGRRARSRSGRCRRRAAGWRARRGCARSFAGAVDGDESAVGVVDPVAGERLGVGGGGHGAVLLVVGGRHGPVARAGGGAGTRAVGEGPGASPAPAGAVPKAARSAGLAGPGPPGPHVRGPARPPSRERRSLGRPRAHALRGSRSRGLGRQCRLGQWSGWIARGWLPARVRCRLPAFV
jgi:hypothetical protein